MPMPGFLSSIADKANSAIQASPLAGHIPSIPSSAPASEGTGTSQGSTQGGSGLKGHPHLGALQHQLRSVAQQYSSTTPIQKIITTSKGVSIDFDSVSRDAKAQSKELYVWGQTEAEDLKDVTDRLAFVNFVQGSLAATLAVKLNDSRAALKELRDAENQLAPRRNIRTGFETQIARIEHNQEKGMERKLAELREQLAKAQSDDAGLEREILILKRKAVKQSEQLKWEALREYGEKIILLSQAATSVAEALPSVPPTPTTPYTGATATAAARAALQRALDNYKTGHVQLPPRRNTPSPTSDTRSFGESHGDELEHMYDGMPVPAPAPSGLPPSPPPGAPAFPQHPLSAAPPPPSAFPQPHSAGSMSMPVPVPSRPGSGSVGPSGSPGGGATFPTHSPTSPVINPALLNQAPAPLPTSPPVAGAISVSPTAPLDPSGTAGAQLPSATPTVAETGVPVAAGRDGPGPASGSLRDLRHDSAPGVPGSADAPVYGVLPPGAAQGQAHPQFESAEDEKRRMQRAERERLLGASGGLGRAGSSASTSGGPPPPPFESAEDEKKRLEREARERLLHGGSGLGRDPTTRSRRGSGPDAEDLPPYQEPGAL